MVCLEITTCYIYIQCNSNIRFRNLKHVDEVWRKLYYGTPMKDNRIVDLSGWMWFHSNPVVCCEPGVFQRVENLERTSWSYRTTPLQNCVRSFISCLIVCLDVIIMTRDHLYTGNIYSSQFRNTSPNSLKTLKKCFFVTIYISIYLAGSILYCVTRR